MADIRIATVESARDLRAFIAFPYELHRRDPLWVPPLRRDVKAMLVPKRNPFFEHAEARYFIARRDGRIVGRIAAIENRAHNEFHADRVGFFGFFESIDDRAVAGALLDAAATWLGERKLNVLRGPASFSTNDEVGLLVEGFDTPPTLMMPHNPRYYPGLMEANGLVKAKDLLVYQSRPETADLADPLLERLRHGAELLSKRYHISVRPIDPKRFDEELALIKQLYNQAWERNWGFVPMTDHEIDHAAAQLKQIMIPDVVVFAYCRDKPIGFSVALPDLNVALKTNPSGRLFPGIVKILWAARKISRLRILMLGTLPEWRGKGVDALMYRHIWERGMARGFHWGEAGWILEDNAAMNNAIERLGFVAYKRYRLYDRPVDTRHPN
jgi:GNAT superfamily N-acetyltransferase